MNVFKQTTPYPKGDAMRRRTILGASLMAALTGPLASACVPTGLDKGPMVFPSGYVIPYKVDAQGNVYADYPKMAKVLDPVTGREILVPATSAQAAAGGGQPYYPGTGGTGGQPYYPGTGQPTPYPSGTLIGFPSPAPGVNATSDMGEDTAGGFVYLTDMNRRDVFIDPIQGETLDTLQQKTNANVYRVQVVGQTDSTTWLTGSSVAYNSNSVVNGQARAVVPSTANQPNQRGKASLAVTDSAGAIKGWVNWLAIRNRLAYWYDDPPGSGRNAGFDVSNFRPIRRPGY